MEILVSWCLKKVEFNSHKVSKLKTFSKFMFTSNELHERHQHLKCI